jgi:hypothetical protein
MFAPFLIIEPFVESIQSILPRSRVLLSPRLRGCLNETLHPGRTLALLVVLLIMVVPVVSCAPRSTVSLPVRTAVPAVDPNPNSVLPYSDQGLSFERISIEQDLSRSKVNCILQDSKGFMWLRTDDGLNKYDGHDFPLYKHSPDDPHSLSHNRVRSLNQDQLGTLGFGTVGRLGDD